MTRYLYLTRHAEAIGDGDDAVLTPAGRRQAVLLGERLRHVPLAAVHHGPALRTTQTAHLVGRYLPDVPLLPAEAAGDYVPYTPGEEEVAGPLLDLVRRFPAAEPALAEAAERAFTGPVAGDVPRHELVVTHNFLIGWLVRAALEAPPRRWLGLNHANAALTVIRYTADRPPALLLLNDTAHLPAGLRWTGFPPELRL
ncbi:histidine phosphatase family protein [Actinomadura sp. ATCC 31491]|uniref:Histidine phosphatase family protein n=1 Tax=Actinomadura luzonensis TaxID=2805427 RepID=A0ABT0FRG1_9ACTN|nr:histidine phosphatase family protein [Actinomadura luzonensis]MCK2214911.1 histidine phosphatase family protein [Actinomadura luzonensis]